VILYYVAYSFNNRAKAAELNNYLYNIIDATNSNERQKTYRLKPIDRSAKEEQGKERTKEREIKR
jgi:hypothetical protein